MTREFLDVRGLLCPLPVIRAQNRVKTLQFGDVLEVTGTDPGLVQDIPSWCRVNGHSVLEVQRKGHEYVVVLEVGMR